MQTDGKREDVLGRLVERARLAPARTLNHGENASVQVFVTGGSNVS